MVDRSALTTGLAVGLGLLGLFFAGAVLRFASRIASYAALVALALLLAYAAYEVVSGWNEAGDRSPAVSGVDVSADESTSPSDESGGSGAGQPAVTDDEIDRELDRLRRDRDTAPGDGRRRETDVETD